MKAVAILMCASLSSTCSAQFCPTLHADFMRRQAAEPFNADAPYTEADGTKHTPYITINGTRANVTVGNGDPYHPMIASDDPDTVHWITHIYLLDQDGGFVGLETLTPVGNSIANVQFDIPSGVQKLRAYEWCNKHGLWAGPMVDATTGHGQGACAKDDVMPTSEASVVADFHRRQAAEPWKSNSPFTEADGAKHTPYIILDGSTATVTVGDGNPYHPMVASNDPGTVHWVTHIYVLDQAGSTVFMQNLDPDGVDVATVTFDVPQSASSLTAYEFCNKHGLWMGPTMQIPTTTTTEIVQETSASKNADVYMIVKTLSLASIVGGIATGA